MVSNPTHLSHYINNLTVLYARKDWLMKARRFLGVVRVLSRRACYNVPLRLAVHERLQEARSSNVLPHGQHRVSALVPTPHHHFPYRVLRTFVHSCSG